jgi:hypothetical protein
MKQQNHVNSLQINTLHSQQLALFSQFHILVSSDTWAGDSDRKKSNDDAGAGRSIVS